MKRPQSNPETIQDFQNGMNHYAQASTSDTSHDPQREPQDEHDEIQYAGHNLITVFSKFKGELVWQCDECSQIGTEAGVFDDLECN